jgi:hypothetical protein
MSFIVQRRQKSSVSVTGELLIGVAHECWTLEPPTPIPAGTYDLTIRYSPRFNRLMPHVENVLGHTGILIHWGNYPKDTENCLLVGSIISENFVGHSRTEFDTLFLKIQDALAEGPQTITYLDPTIVAVDLDSEIAG